MKKLFIYRFILYNLYLFIVTIFTVSCINQEKENNDPIFKTESTIDFNLIDCLNESNKKTIELSSITFSQTKDVKTLQLLLKIKKDHQKIDSELKKLTEKNWIILPKLIYNLNLNADSLKDKNSNLYLLKALETEIKNQIELLNQIEKTSQNTDVKTFATQSKKMVQINNDSLKTL
jgi:hypothetical protein